VFALRWGQGAKAGLLRAGFFGSFADRLVLPRMLRRPARLLERLTSGDVEPPRFAASFGAAAVIGVFSVYGAWLGGHAPAIAQALTARSGFAVDEVRVFGNAETSEIDILQQLGLDGWTSLIGFDADAARQRIAELDWIKTASVRKVYPDTIEVRIEERQPYAIWQHGSQLTVVERSGEAIAPFTGGRLSGLPLVIGYGAAEHAAGFVERIRRFPELASRVKGYMLVAERRWDMRLENGITIRLPEHGDDAVLAELLRLDREHGLLSRDIAAVDLRIDDRLVVKLTPAAALQREAALAAIKKAAGRKPGKRI
jgi:cell division protein FtsQ